MPNTTKHCFTRLFRRARVRHGAGVQEPIIEVSEEVFAFLKAEFTINKQKEN